MRVKTKDRIGQKFGRLTIVSLATHSRKNGNTVRIANCQCDCGNIHSTELPSIIVGNTKSCGCLRRELLVKSKKNNICALKHNQSGSRTYISWTSMKQRCGNTNCRHYDYYGGRGIKVCKEWEDSFEAFLKDMGERPEGTSIDRVDPDGNYEPGNCRWATPKEQIRNRRSYKKKAA